MFHPITSFVTLVECVLSHTITFISVSKSQSSIEVSSNYKVCIFCSFLCASRSSCTFFDVVFRISRVGEIYTHQFDALAVDHDCGGDGTLLDVFCVNYSLFPLLVQ